MAEFVKTVIVGGGQAGLAASYHLTQHGREHTVLEKSRVGESWRSGRWDSFTLVTPNWMLRLPGFLYAGNDPDNFLTRDQVVLYLQDYVRLFSPPLRLGVEVTAVERLADRGRYVVSTSTGPLEAENVIVATGLFQTPRVPPLSAKLPSQIVQVHSSRFGNEDELPSGAVLVVGSGQSGAQIAEELNDAGRKVFLCVGRAGRMPRRYRGRDITWWLNEIGFMDRTVDTLPSPRAKFAGSVQASGKGGGHTLNLHQFARDGVVLLGRLLGVCGQAITLAPDLMENLAGGDKVAADIKAAIDSHILEAGLDVPREPADGEEARDGYGAEVITELDLAACNVRSVIWATGYTFDFGWVKLPVFDDDGYPVQKRGVTEFPGLCFLGLPFLHKFKSGLLFGVGEDAEHVTSHLASRA